MTRISKKTSIISILCLALAALQACAASPTPKAPGQTWGKLSSVFSSGSNKLGTSSPTPTFAFKPRSSQASPLQPTAQTQRKSETKDLSENFRKNSTQSPRVWEETTPPLTSQTPELSSAPDLSSPLVFSNPPPTSTTGLSLSAVTPRPSSSNVSSVTLNSNISSKPSLSGFAPNSFSKTSPSTTIGHAVSDTVSVPNNPQNPAASATQSKAQDRIGSVSSGLPTTSLPVAPPAPTQLEPQPLLETPANPTQTASLALTQEPATLNNNHVGSGFRQGDEGRSTKGALFKIHIAKPAEIDATSEVPKITFWYSYDCTTIDCVNWVPGPTDEGDFEKPSSMRSCAWYDSQGKWVEDYAKLMFKVTFNDRIGDIYSTDGYESASYIEDCKLRKLNDFRETIPDPVQLHKIQNKPAMQKLRISALPEGILEAADPQ